MSEPIGPLTAALLGAVEGITEYLPISSTGHLILVSHVIGQKGDGADAFDIFIQLGAILAVVVHYRRLLWAHAKGLLRGERVSGRLALALIIGFVPTALAGVLLRKKVKAALFGPMPVAVALVVGGIAMIVLELVLGRRTKGNPNGSAAAVHLPRGLDGIEHVTPWRAFLIGMGQCASMWPGSSRSMCTIVAGRLAGLSAATSAEFSFLLGLPTLGAATLYEAYKSRDLLRGIGEINILVGLVASFFVAWAVIAAFLAYLQRRGLIPFGVYRIVLGLLVFFVLARMG